MSGNGVSTTYVSRWVLGQPVIECLALQLTRAVLTSLRFEQL